MKRIVTIAIMLVVVAGAGAWVAKSRAAAPTEKTQFKITQAETGIVKKTVSATGTLQPWRVVDIKSKAGGRILHLGDTSKKTNVDVGSIVKKGDIIAEIDPTDTRLSYDQAQADINAAQAKIQGSELTWELQQQQSRLAVESAKSNLESSKANLNSARARLETAKQQMQAQPGLTAATVGSAKANLDNAQKQLSEMRDATLTQDRAAAESMLGQAQANLKNADANLARQQKLLEKGFVSQSTVDQALASRDVCKAQVESAQRKMNTIDKEQQASEAAMVARVAQADAQYKSALAGQVDIEVRKSAYNEAKAAAAQAEKQVQNATTAVELAERNQKNNDIRKTDIFSANAQKARAQAAFTNADTTLKQTRVEAPSDGIILKKYVDEGTIISSALSFAASGNSIVQLGDIQRMYVDVTVDETDIANVDDGQAVDVTVEAYPSTPLEGKVIRIDPQTEVIQNVTMIHVRVEIDNSNQAFQLMKPGMNATCEFVIKKKSDVLYVPTEAVHTTDTERYVEIAQGGTPYKGDDGKGQPDPLTKIDVKPIKKVVTTGIEGNDSIEILTGIKEGDVVITQKIEPAPKTAGSPFSQQRMGGFGSGSRR